MGQKAEYKSAVRSRRLIRQAFTELLKEKPLDKITVADIVRRADINRGTFYAHYSDVRAVIGQIEDEIIAKMLEIADNAGYKDFCTDPLPALLRVSKTLEENADFYRTLVNSNGSGLFMMRLMDVYVEHMMSDASIPEEVKTSPSFIAMVQYYAGGVINTYAAWFRDKIPLTLDEISLMLSLGIKEGTKLILDK